MDRSHRSRTGRWASPPTDASVTSALLEAGRDCADVITQLAAVSRALDRAGFKLIASGLQQCITAQAAGQQPPLDQARLERLFLSLA